jgi:hypothetical protein
MAYGGAYKMLFALHRSVPANTPATAPDKQTFNIARGTITKWFILFPVETANVLRIQIRYHEHQLIPLEEDDYLYGGGYAFNLEDDTAIDELPYELTVYAYNTDTTHAHEYNVYCILKPKGEEPVEALLGAIWEEVRGFVGGGE